MLVYLSLLDTPEEKSKFECLYNSYKHTMLYVAFNILKDHQLSEDAVHEAFIRIAKNFRKVGDIECPQTKGFVVIIVKNVALSMLKKNSKIKITDDIEDINIIPDKNQNEIFDNLNFELIVSSIIGLPELYKDVIYLSIIDEYTISDISHLLNLPKEVIKKRLQRGRKILINNLQKEGIVSGE